MMSKGISKGFFILILFIVTAAFLDVLGPYYPRCCGRLFWR